VRDYFLSLIRGERRGLWPAVERGGLWLLSWPYRCGMALRNRLFERGWKKIHRAGVPVISIGNLTVGGTGKTPCVEYVARFFREHDRRVAILSRGYGAEAGRNDEARLLEDNLPDVPHLQGPDRVALAQVAVEELESEILVLDDGFQHRRLHRDLDIVLIDMTAPWGYGYLLPRGLLREPPSSLGRAGLVMLTRCDQVGPDAVRHVKERVARISPQVSIVETSHRAANWINADKATRPITDLHGRPVAAFCGIGNPEAFRRSLIQAGVEVRNFRVFPDHHGYSRDDVEDLRAWARQQAAECAIVTTQKDLVKIPLTRLGERELWALKIELCVEVGLESLHERLMKTAPESACC
jgi:tetraacyldisaccharide 4'-kinase